MSVAFIFSYQFICFLQFLCLFVSLCFSLSFPLSVPSQHPAETDGHARRFSTNIAKLEHFSPWLVFLQALTKAMTRLYFLIFSPLLSISHSLLFTLIQYFMIVCGITSFGHNSCSPYLCVPFLLNVTTKLAIHVFFSSVPQNTFQGPSASGLSGVFVKRTGI